MNVKSINKISIKGNLLFNFLRVFSTAFIVIFTMPYINRILGAANVGKVEYVFTILYYFILFSSLGIPVYGIREVSKTRDNTKKLNLLIVELMLILAFTTVVAYFLLFTVFLNIELFQPYKELIYIMCIMIFLNNSSAEWYFQGIENQKFITVRSIIVKFLVFGLYFILIKQESDYKLYAALLIILWFGSNIVGLIVVLKKIFEHKFKISELNFKRHFKPILSIFVTTISLSIYFQLAFFFIGTIAGDKYVGYYLTANSLVRSVVTFISVIGSVMLPRLSYLHDKDKDKYNEYLKKTFSFMMILAIPCCSYFILFSDQIILLMGGEGFMPASTTMKILAPLCIFASLAYFLGLLVLYPQGKENIYTKATMISAVFSIVLNLILVKQFQQNGAAVVILISEFIAIVFMWYYISNNRILENYVDRNFIKVISINILLLVVFYCVINNLDLSNNIVWIATSLVFAILYILLLLISEEKNSREVFSNIMNKFHINF